MATPHKHAEVIKAWADGALIQKEYRVYGEVKWFDDLNPSWNPHDNFRVKTVKKTPGQVYFEAASPSTRYPYLSISHRENYENGARAVIEAYKRGEFNEDCRC